MKLFEVKTWEEFQSTGLLLFINMFLHIFGWAIVFECQQTCEPTVLRVYPARVKFRGFSHETTADAFVRLGKYMQDNATMLYKEVTEETE
jgi:hypothetical protein